jgi:hypothetical protein
VYSIVELKNSNAVFGDAIVTFAYSIVTCAYPNVGLKNSNIVLKVPNVVFGDSIAAKNTCVASFDSAQLARLEG